MSFEEIRTYINALRRKSADKPLDEQAVQQNPLDQFSDWFEEAVDAQVVEPNAMVLASVSEFGYPSTRIVYMRDIDEKGVVFYTNYLSQKGKEINDNSATSILFFWGELERQVRIFGRAQKVAPAMSDAYFASRPRESQLGAWSSEQSSNIQNRGVLEERYQYYKDKFKGLNVPRPEHWGGFQIVPDKFEFWQGRPNRMHDRIVYLKSADSDTWTINRLAP